MKRTPTIAGGALFAALAIFPVVSSNPYYTHLIVLIGIYAVLIFGLDIVVGYTGEVSIGHAGLFGIGAYTTGLLLASAGLSIWIALPAALVVTALFGVVLAVPSLRLTGPYLAMVTLAFGTIVQILLNEMDFLTNGAQGLAVAKPVIAGHPVDATDFYYFVLAVSALAMFVVSRILSSHYGRAFLALRGSPVAADCMGVSVYRYKVIAFVISAAFAGLAGGLYALSEEYIAPNTFSMELSTLFLLAVTLGGRRSRAGSLIGATTIVVLPNLLSDLSLFRTLTVVLAVVVALLIVHAWRTRRATWRTLAAPAVVMAGFVVFAFSLTDMVSQRLTIFGLLILGVVYYLPDGIAGYVRDFAGSWRRKPAETDDVPAIEVGAWGAPRAERRADGDALPECVLDLASVVMQFGGLRALNDVSLKVTRGTVHGLIGPNGSGKSTMMNVLTGVYAATSGNIAFNGERCDGLKPARIAQRGIARTFQNVQLFGDMSALDNVLVGLHQMFRSNLLDVILRTPRYRREDAAARARAAALLGFVGMQGLAATRARDLPYGRQRMLEIARALGTGPSLLLLDEPAAGLRPNDLPELRRMIEKIREHGITVILIEHHMDLVMAICDQVSVLDFGQKIAEGPPTAVSREPRVIEAYLGAAAAAPVVSGAA
ncbi:amino acid/amide ABC transporter membrane protein 2 (HAAT family) /amino acid/amide ABC transporter ATP-binding protein 1 (HAAT family) [Paraburkholderia caballeronis]|uniref:branched-chain amino acid ABC transporter ATP-binding protein/permease n=1 Tax=Paraburkholderia caballeronis TaxID=416943 RepID=UPI0010654CE1|nr:branched-chain amino acid ABC transporter ATP-binding protein/permease [Paraburkholderia caballeronis]TDV35603.1 amino acid/amide ABC transporter membrane protein 2 (HAAT family) /amino acid/amide ABC transporter ATP-binding protein 1 (HAAT family) [Paraburkholderia caballeronis]